MSHYFLVNESLFIGVDECATAMDSSNSRAFRVALLDEIETFYISANTLFLYADALHVFVNGAVSISQKQIKLNNFAIEYAKYCEYSKCNLSEILSLGAELKSPIGEDHVATGENPCVLLDDLFSFANNIGYELNERFFMSIIQIFYYEFKEIRRIDNIEGIIGEVKRTKAYKAILKLAKGINKETDCENALVTLVNLDFSLEALTKKGLPIYADNNTQEENQQGKETRLLKVALAALLKEKVKTSKNPSKYLNGANLNVTQVVEDILSVSNDYPHGFGKTNLRDGINLAIREHWEKLKDL